MELIPNKQIIIALDVSLERAKEIVDSTRDLLSLYKIGPVLWLQWGPGCLEFFAQRGARVMIDFKFHDIPNTVKESFLALGRLPGAQAIWGLTAHTLGGFSMLRALALERENFAGNAHVMILGVTVLTSLAERDLYRVGINRTPQAQVKKLAQLALDAGLDGVVASAWEIEVIHKTCDPNFVTVIPGIRLTKESAGDQKRVATPLEALRAGANYLVIGRDITGAANPRDRVENLIETIRGYHVKTS